MLRSLFAGISGLRANQTALDVTGKIVLVLRQEPQEFGFSFHVSIKTITQGNVTLILFSFVFKSHQITTFKIFFYVNKLN